MDDLRITQKSFDTNSKKRLCGSLALRVFFVSLVLLVLPLLIHSLFLYRTEYRQKKRDLFISLKILGESHVLLLDQMIRYQKDSLQTIASSVNFQELKKPVNTVSEVQRYLRSMARRYDVTEIFYLSRQLDNSLVCTASSSEKMIGFDFGNFSEFQRNYSHSSGIFLGNNPVFSEKRLFVVELIDQEMPIGAFVAATSAASLLDRLATIEDSPYPIDLSLLLPSGKIFTSSGSHLSEEYANLREVSGISNAYVVEGKYFAVRMPIAGTNLSLLLTVPEHSIYHLQIWNYIYRIATLLFFIIIFGGGGAYLFTYRIAQPLKALLSVMEKVYQGDMNARFKKDPMGFEINLLGQHFNRMIDSVVAHQKEAQKERLKKEVLEQEFNIGREIQMSLFPLHVPEIPGLDIASDYHPAKEVGGDFYDFFLLEDAHALAIAIADTSGKGISACLYSLGIRSMLRSFLIKNQDLREAIEETNNLFCLDVGESGIFVTAWVAIYYPETNQLTYCSAGHHPALLKRKDGSLLELQTPGIALGATLITDVQVQTIQLKKEDTLLLYTDGVVDAQNEKHELFGSIRLKEYLVNAKKEKSQEILRGLVQEVERYTNNLPLFDDLTLLVMRMQQ